MIEIVPEKEFKRLLEANDPFGRKAQEILDAIDLECAIEARERRKEQALREAWDWERKAYVADAPDDITFASEAEFAYIRATGISDIPARFELLGMLRQIQHEIRVKGAKDAKL